MPGLATLRGSARNMERIEDVVMTDSSVALLPDRGIVEVEGDDVVDFLQSLLTNDVERAAPGGAMFAGLLTPQGKILFDFLIYSPAPNRFWLDCPAEFAGDLARRLNLYRLRAKVTVADRSAEMAVAAGQGPEQGEAPGALGSFADPRHAGLPRRYVLPAAAASGSTEARAVGLNAYHAARIALCVPEGARDYVFGEAFPHEVCYDLLNGVDFEKGCYVGQEVVSRMHHRGVAKTRIAGVRGAAELPAIGTEISGGEYPVGQLGSSQGTLGIALIRLDRADEVIGHGVPLRAANVTLTLRRPPWANYDVPAAEAAA
jgi:folate-binding protein YgfZ